jgi:hypothetical protein
MKIKRFFLTMALSALSLSTFVLYGQTGSTQAQDTSSLITKYEQKQQQERDKQRLNDASEAKKETKADARQTQRVNKEAMDASKESKKAYRAEKKAQKARKNSTEQTQKAVDARKKSDRN